MTSRFKSKTTRLDELREQVSAFHAKHPEVWDLFSLFTMEKINQGFQNYSARGIFHRIRWETDKPIYSKGYDFKMNDHYSPFYARRFMAMHPEHKGFFRTRQQTSEDSYPSQMSPLTPRDYQ